jgi:hypothetical protein
LGALGVGQRVTKRRQTELIEQLALARRRIDGRRHARRPRAQVQGCLAGDGCSCVGAPLDLDLVEPGRDAAAKVLARVPCHLQQLLDRVIVLAGRQQPRVQRRRSRKRARAVARHARASAARAGAQRAPSADLGGGAAATGTALQRPGAAGEQQP